MWNRIGRRSGAAALLAVALFLGMLRLPAGALELEGQVRGSRTASVEARGDRSFRLEFRVWSGEEVNRAVEPCDMILLVDVSQAMGNPAGKDGKEEASRLDSVKRGAEDLLEKLGKAAPDSRAGLVLFGEDVTAAGPERLGEKGREALSSALSAASPQSRWEPDYAQALAQAAKLVEKLGDRGDRPLYLVTLSSGQWAGETGGASEPLRELQKLRDQGARAYTVLLCGSPEPEAEEFWQAMSSAPLSTHHYVCAGEAESCLDQIRRDIASAFSVEVRQRLDPRFEIPAQEQDRLRREGAHLTREKSGLQTVSWEAELPRSADSPWSASLSIRAKEGFPGGNDITVDSEGTGVFRSGKLIASLPGITVNVPLRLSLSDVETEQFLGEKVRTWREGATVEEAMGWASEASWFGRGKTGSFSCLWETEAGDPVGSLKQLGCLAPTRDAAYRFRVTYRPDTPGLVSAGEPVKETQISALYRVKVRGGTLRIKAVPEGGLGENAALAFRIQGPDRRTYFRTALPETDPETGEAFLEAELTGLPYGVYTVTPLSRDGWRCREGSVTCRLGVWERDDTVSPERDADLARFTLERPGGFFFFSALQKLGYHVQ